jgi:hypothetical protein
MEQSYKHSSPTIDRLCFLRGRCKVVVKIVRQHKVKWGIEFRDASLPEYELGSS